MAKKVAIVGAAMARAGKSPIPSWELFASPALEAIKNAELDPDQIQALHLGNVYSAFTENQTSIAPLALSSMGIRNNIPSTRYETACASSSVAFRQGYRSQARARA